VEEYRLKIPVWSAPSASHTISVEKEGENAVSSATVSAPPSVEPIMPSRIDIAQRELQFNFFKLLTPDRYAAATEAKLLRDGDDSLHPQAMWAEVFRRAVTENRLAEFWNAVASRTPAIKDQLNPFNPS
jgi:hypothetical protein